MKPLALFFAVIGSAAMAANVSNVKVQAMDGFGGDLGSVAVRCQTRVGAAYDPVTLSRDVVALRESGAFEEISADAVERADGIEVTFLVRRKMRYQAPMTVTGCDFFSESKIASESELKDGFLYGKGDLEAAAAKVRLAYQKKYFLDAKVVPKVQMLPGGNNCTVTMEITEGIRTKIRDYVFEGAENADQDDIRKAIGEYPWWNPMGWFSDSPVTEDQLAQCVSKAEEFYRDLGYLDVKIANPKRVATDSDKIDIVFAVTEGTRYTIGDSRIEGLTRYPEQVVAGKSALPATGAVAGAKDLSDAAHRIEVTVGSGDSGLADTHVAVKYIPREDDPKVVDIVYNVTEGVPVVIDSVLVRGNDYTMDKVIRREIALGPGDRMLADRAERSQKRLENLDYFSRVRYYLEPVAGKAKTPEGAEYRNLVYEVEEKNTGSFMVGIGASSVDSVFVTAEVSQNNFDIFAPSKWFRGAGQKGRAYVQWGPRIQTFSASVTEPYLFDRHLEFTVEAHRTGRWYDQYDLYRNGAMLELRYPVKFWPTWSPFGSLGLSYVPEYVQMDDCDYGYYYFNNRQVSLSGFPDSEENKYGEAWENKIELFWAHDNRDNFRMPSSGGKTRVFGDAVIGDNQFWRLGVNHRHYFPIWKRFNHVLMGAIRLETEDAFSDEVPIYDRMFLGGPRSIRGVRYRHASPLATRFANGYGDAMPWGGKTLFCMNFEYTIPIVKMLRLAVFTDLGEVGEDTFSLEFSDNFAWTAGVGVRLDIPMFPIRLDFAAPIKKPDAAEEEVFSFTVGYDF